MLLRARRSDIGPHPALFLVQAIEEADLGIIPKVAYRLQLLLLRQIVWQLELRPDLHGARHMCSGGTTSVTTVIVLTVCADPPQPLLLL